MLLQQIRCFVAVAEAGSFTAAGRILNLSQPALGAHAKHLEAHLGCQLLKRHSRGVELTPAGQAFLVEARAVLTAVDHARDAVTPFIGHTEIQVILGFTPTSGRTLVPDLLIEAAQRVPEMRIQLRPGMSEDHRRNLLASTELDAAFCYDPESHEQLIEHPLYEEDLFLVGPPEQVNSAEGPISFACLATMPLALDHRFHAARRLIEEAAVTHGTALRIELDVEPAEVKRALIMRRSHCTVVPYGLFMEEIIQGQMGARLITAPSIRRTLSLVLRRSLPSTVALGLLKLVRPIVQRKIKEGAYGWLASTPTILSSVDGF
jgi:LysR family nitrogen assimilation transcriptional regulator